MGKIIGEGITFDDCSSCTGLFRSNSESGRSVNTSDKENRIEYFR